MYQVPSSFWIAIKFLWHFVIFSFVQFDFFYSLISSPIKYRLELQKENILNEKQKIRIKFECDKNFCEIFIRE